LSWVEPSSNVTSTYGPPREEEAEDEWYLEPCSSRAEFVTADSRIDVMVPTFHIFFDMATGMSFRMVLRMEANFCSSTLGSAYLDMSLDVPILEFLLRCTRESSKSRRSSSMKSRALEEPSMSASRAGCHLRLSAGRSSEPTSQTRMSPSAPPEAAWPLKFAVEMRELIATPVLVADGRVCPTRRASGRPVTLQKAQMTGDPTIEARKTEEWGRYLGVGGGGEGGGG
jgi:hypothetical protein